MTQIGYIIPDEKLAGYARDVVRKHNIDAKIEVGAFEHGVKKRHMSSKLSHLTFL
jgi:hypothetical protein